jgi:hypothetical protein
MIEPQKRRNELKLHGLLLLSKASKVRPVPPYSTSRTGKPRIDKHFVQPIRARGQDQNTLVSKRLRERTRKLPTPNLTRGPRNLRFAVKKQRNYSDSRRNNGFILMPSEYRATHSAPTRGIRAVTPHAWCVGRTPMPEQRAIKNQLNRDTGKGLPRSGSQSPGKSLKSLETKPLEATPYRSPHAVLSAG